jgi:prepilin-type N-terminal cleavage/methylation domain-containing protein
MRDAKALRSDKGFTLMEVMIAIVVLTIGLTGLAAMLGDALTYMQSSQDGFIAQQKVEEAIEAIFTAKYDDSITFAQIANTNSTPPGIFLAGAQPILQPGANGLVGTTADNTANPAYLINPGPDGLIGTADDIKVPLYRFTRTIAIAPAPCAAAGETNVTTVTVTVNYTSGIFKHSYSMQTCVSAFN